MTQREFDNLKPGDRIEHLDLSLNRTGKMLTVIRRRKSGALLIDKGRGYHTNDYICNCRRVEFPLDAEPSEACQVCRSANITWFVRSDIWNRVMRREGQAEQILCPTCFVRRAESEGVKCTGWELVPENYETGMV